MLTNTTGLCRDDHRGAHDRAYLIRIPGPRIPGPRIPRPVQHPAGRVRAAADLVVERRPADPGTLALADDPAGVARRPAGGGDVPRADRAAVRLPGRRSAVPEPGMVGVAGRRLRGRGGAGLPAVALRPDRLLRSQPAGPAGRGEPRLRRDGPAPYG